MSESMNRAVAGYHMLVILSAIDGKVNSGEQSIIRNYMEENFSGEVNFEQEMNIIKSISTNDYAVRFNDAMNLFYMQSTKSERNHFLDIATRLVVADSEISPKENLFLNELYYAWEEETEE
jgi:DNA polymerase III sliding clamp (beta) subunit (PCNA family)